MTNFAFILFMGQPAGATTGQSTAMPFIMLILIFVVFYFFLIRPQMKKQKEMTNYRNALKKGDKVITTGGVYGRITEVKDHFVMMDAGGDVKLKVDKSALLKDPSTDEQS